jgi:hypothetical protein
MQAHTGLISEKMEATPLPVDARRGSPSLHCLPDAKPKFPWPGEFRSAQTAPFAICFGVSTWGNERDRPLLSANSAPSAAQTALLVPVIGAPTRSLFSLRRFRRQSWADGSQERIQIVSDSLIQAIELAALLFDQHVTPRNGASRAAVRGA